ncbi:hypothetical protein [Burkholderia lata]|uniref:hypothetical protein n=1 Tax=Burkholderia lata (strain ATCC 17760 / DSM 23089 / LMG 22485 / NCIMB 9086 / R18194 / 383) TaxID=482957 RepID=UPI0015839766|nr:hypothetical protein [Burkholderia lata]
MDQIISRHTMNFSDLKFTVMAEVHEHRVEFKIYDIAGWIEGPRKGFYDCPIWRRADACSSDDTVEAIEESEVYLHGQVKFDGCSNWHFDEQDRVMLHGCCKADVHRFGDIMGACWDWAAELLPNWIGSD